MSNDDTITLGGIPAAKLEARRAKRESSGASDRPTQPLLHASGDMPDGARSPDAPPPDRRRALDLARSFMSGPDAQCVVGRDGCEEMARFIRAQPDYVAVINEWLVATVAIERSRARGEPLSPVALVRLDAAERALAGLSSLDHRFVTELTKRGRSTIAGRHLAVALDLDQPISGDVTGELCPRIWTPRDDLTCGVCGLTEGEHIEIRCPAAVSSAAPSIKVGWGER